MLPLLYEVNSLTSITEALNLPRPVPDSNAQTVDLKVLQIKIPDKYSILYISVARHHKLTDSNMFLKKIWINVSMKYRGSAVKFATGDKSIYAGEIMEKKLNTTYKSKHKGRCHIQILLKLNSFRKIQTRMSI